MGILLEEPMRWWVEHDGSLAVVYDTAETDDTRAAIRDLIDTLAQGQALFVVVHQRSAMVLTFDLASLADRLRQAEGRGDGS